MIVECGNCGTKFNLDDSKIPDEGAWVRCSNCGDVFQAIRPDAQPLEPQPAPEPEAPAPPQDEPAPTGQPGLNDLDMGLGLEDADDDGLDGDFRLDAEFEEKAKVGCMGRLFKAVFWLVAIFIILLVLAIGGLVAMDRLGAGGEIIKQVKDLNIPYMDMILTGEGASPGGESTGGVEEGGAIAMEVKDPKGMWRNNKKSGRLFIINGWVINKYKTVRSEILVQGILRDTKDQPVAKATVYAGPRFTPEELTKLPLEEIQARLSNPKGSDGSLYVVPPGEKIYFMVVMGNLPSDLQLYTVEVVGSKPLSGAK
jgi:predicted Zn finger-like uncharacterized protein